MVPEVLLNGDAPDAGAGRLAPYPCAAPVPVGVPVFPNGVATPEPDCCPPNVDPVAGVVLGVTLMFARLAPKISLRDGVLLSNKDGVLLAAKGFLSDAPRYKSSKRLTLF